MKPVKAPVTVALLRHGGSHLIRPLVKRMAKTQIIEPGNHGFPPYKAEGKVVVFTRRPRNRTVAAVKWEVAKGKQPAVTDAAVAEMIRRPRYMSDMKEWAQRWCNWPRSLRLRFEEFPTDGEAQIARLAAFLETQADPAALYAWIWDKGRTVSGAHSDFRNVFGPLATAAWDEMKGDEVMEIMGYSL